MNESLRRFIQNPGGLPEIRSESQLRRLNGDIHRIHRKLSMNVLPQAPQTTVILSLDKFKQISREHRQPLPTTSVCRPRQFPGSWEGKPSTVVVPAASLRPLDRNWGGINLERTDSFRHLPVQGKGKPRLPVCQTQTQHENRLLRKANSLADPRALQSQLTNIINLPAIPSVTDAPVRSLRDPAKRLTAHRFSISKNMVRISVAEPVPASEPVPQTVLPRLRNFNDFYPPPLDKENASSMQSACGNYLRPPTEEQDLPITETQLKNAFDSLVNAVAAPPGFRKEIRRYRNRSRFGPNAGKKRQHKDNLSLETLSESSGQSDEEGDQSARPPSRSHACDETPRHPEGRRRRDHHPQPAVPSLAVKMDHGQWKEDMRVFSSLLKMFVEQPSKDAMIKELFREPIRRIPVTHEPSFIDLVQGSRASEQLKSGPAWNAPDGNVQDRESGESVGRSADDFQAFLDDIMMAACPFIHAKPSRNPLPFAPVVRPTGPYRSFWMRKIDLLLQPQVNLAAVSDFGFYSREEAVYGSRLGRRILDDPHWSVLAPVVVHVANDLHAEHCALL